MAKKNAAANGEPSGEALPDLEEAPVSSLTRTPGEWAREFFPASDKGRQHPKLMQHGAAEALHGWKLHEHHAGAPIQLTREDYAAALRAANSPENTYAPHPAALSPHRS